MGNWRKCAKSLHCRYFKSFFEGSWIAPTASTIAFILVTCLFILFADLIPKRIAITYPEMVALSVVGIMNFSMYVFKPLVWFFLILLLMYFSAYFAFLLCVKMA